MSLWKMVNYCHIFGCTNRSDGEKHLELYSLPKVTKREQCQKLSEEKEVLVVRQAQPGSTSQKSGKHHFISRYCLWLS